MCGFSSIHFQKIFFLRSIDCLERRGETAETALIEHVADGRIRRTGLGDSALWQPASAPVMAAPAVAAAV